MPAHNADVTAVFEEIADLLEIEGSNPFRIRAYRNAARTLRDLHREVVVLLSMNSDAHSVLELEHLRYGVGQARRGWLEKEDGLNAMPLPSLRPLLKRTMVKS